MRRKSYIEIPQSARRDFIKWTVGVGAALGLRPWKVCEVNESVVGPAVAQQASSMPVNRFIGNIMGNGGLAWMTQLWPQTAQALNTSGSPSYYPTVLGVSGTTDQAQRA